MIHYTSITADQTYTVYAAGYDLYGNYISDQSVTWTGSGVCSSNLSLASGTSTTFTAVTAGIGTITADHASIIDDVTGTITVGVGAASSFVVTTEHSGTETAGISFSVTLTAKDGDGNTATGYTGAHSTAWTWTATNSPGGIAPTKPSDGSQTFTAGVAIISEFTLTNSGETPTITAAAGIVNGTCAAVTVNNAALNYVKVEDASNGAGSEVTKPSITADQTYTVYAAGYDLYGNYISDQTVTWTGSGVCSSNLSPASGTSTTFSAVTAGIGTITADHASVIDDVTGTITVGVGAASSFVVTTEHSGTETAGNSFSVTLTALDGDGNTATSYTGAHNTAWTWTATNSPGGIAPTKPSDGSQTFTAGIAAISGFTLTSSGETPTITAAAGIVNGTSAAVTVIDAALNYVKVEDAANGAGSEVTTPSITADQTYTVYAAGYDLYGNYISDQTVTWTGSGVCGSNLSPISGTSTTFTAVTAGAGTITANHASATNDVTGTITVSVGAAASFVVTTEFSGTETAGTSFSVTLTAKDGDSNTATGYTGTHSLAWTWTATNSPNAIAPTKPSEGNQTFTAGVAIISGFALTNSGESPTITAAEGSVNGTCAAITVNDAALNYVKVEDAANGAGSEVTTHSMTADQTYTVYAAGYDLYGNYIIDQTVTWTGTGICGSNLSPTSGTSTTFTAVTAGIGTITADHASIIDDVTGTITVGVGAASSFAVTTEHSGTETAGTSFSVTLTAKDGDGNTAIGYIGAHSINWTWTATNSPGGIAPTKPLDGNQTFTAGIATISGFTLTSSGETPTITAAAGIVNGTSAAVTVIDAALNYIKVEDAANGAGSEVTTPSITADQTYTVYAAGYDLYGNYISDQTVTWTGSGVCSSNLSPISGTSTTFTAATAGTGTITADHASVIDDVTGTITVSVGAAASFVVTTEHSGTETAGTSFSVTLTAKDGDGNTAIGYIGAHSINWTWTATNSPNAIAPTKPSDGSQTFTSGIATISGFTLTSSGETPTITAAAGIVNGTSAAVTVIDAALNYIKVEDAANGAGSEVTTPSITADQTYTVYAAGYDLYGNYISDQSVTWTGTGVCSSKLSPASGTSTTFTAVTAGTGTITADHSSVTDDTTGTITVSVGVAASFIVTTEHSGTETAGTSFSVTLTAKDGDGNTAIGYTGAHSINWTWTATNSPGGIAPTKPSNGSQTFTAGVATISEFTLVNSSEAPTITAAASSVNGTSSAITVNDAALNYVKIEDAANGAGSKVTTPSITADQTYVVYAAGYDLYGNYISDQSVTWTGAGVCSSNLSPTSGTSTTFTAVTAGTGTITADHASAANDVTGTITVGVGAASSFVVTTEFSGTETAGTSFGVTLTALDGDGNTATGYTGAHSINWTWTATNSPGGIAPTKSSDGNQTFTAGVATISEFTLTSSGETPTITAAAGSVNGTSAAVTVNNAALNYVKVEDAANGAGSEVTTPSITADQTYTVYAAGYDLYGNYISDQTVTWTGTGVCSSNLSPASGTSTTFTAVTAGIGTITADHASVTDDVTGTITVGVGAAASFVVTTEHSGTETAGIFFSVTLTAKDGDGNTATGYTGAHSTAWTWTATNSPGGIAPTKPSDGNQTFTAGVATISGFTLVNSDETPTITAAASSVNGTSSAITVNDAALNYVKIEDAANGAGSEVTTPSITADQTYVVYAAGYDLYGNYISDQSVTWTGTGVCSSNLSPASGTSTTFTAVTAGTGTITADHASLIDDTTGTITVSVGSAASFIVTTEFSGTETAGTSFSVTLTAKDGDGNIATGYTGAHSTDWTWTATNSPNAIAPTKPSDGSQTFTAGIATISGFTLVNSSEAPTITATAGSVNGTSEAITVNATAPTVTTTAISNITAPTASSGGNVTSDGGVSVTARGVCWNTSTNPTIADSQTTDGTSTGSFISSITGLSPMTTYHVRAYATNSVDTSYGSEKTFTTIASPIISGTITVDGAAEEVMVISGLSGVVMSGLPDNPQNDMEGHYTASINYGWSGTVTPTKTGYTFNPSSKTYANVTSDKTAEDYTATLNTYTLSIQVSPLDKGSVTKNPDKSSYDHGETVELTASANTDHSFSVWTGEVPTGHENDNPLTIIMGSDKSITANIALSIPPGISLSTNTLGFGATTTGIKSSDQQFRISNSGGGSLSWSITDDKDWLSYNPATGIETGVVTVSVNPSGLTTGIHNAILSVSSADAHNAPQTIAVSLTVKDLSDCDPSFGSFDTPIDGTSEITGAIPVTGWVLDDIGIESVKFYRDPVAGENTEDLVYIGEAVFVEGARPDVEQGYPSYPLNYQAGWGYMILTNFLPDQGNGTFKIHAYVTDKEGHTVSLGTKTIHCDNANAVKPFGAIDTPTQGGTETGSFFNSGWVLTPLPNSIPTDGSTINVWVDGVRLGNPAYNQYRVDIATLFPDYANTDGAVGAYYLDTTPYTNGVHTIAWSVADNAGNSEGIGSRFFTISNTGTGGSAQAGIQSHKENLRPSLSYESILNMPVNFDPVEYRIGYKEDKKQKIVNPDSYGSVEIEIREVERVAVDLSKGINTGNLVVGEKLRPLPIGSSLDKEKGIFYWQPGPGFIGDYDLVFIKIDEFGMQRKINVRVKIRPKF